MLGVDVLDVDVLEVDVTDPGSVELDSVVEGAAEDSDGVDVPVASDSDPVQAAGSAATAAAARAVRVRRAHLSCRMEPRMRRTLSTPVRGAGVAARFVQGGPGLLTVARHGDAGSS